MKEIIAVFIGGGLGSMLRFGLAKSVSALHNLNFPISTLVINILACLAVGFIIGFADTKQLLSPTTRIFWITGFCGGFSTFSAFSYDTLILIQQEQISNMLLYVFASILICLVATFFGLLIAQKIYY